MQTHIDIQWAFVYQIYLQDFAQLWATVQDICPKRQMVGLNPRLNS